MRNVLVGILLGLFLGLWFGVNLGKGYPIYSNPFAERSLGEMIGDKSDELLEESGKALEKTGKRLKEQLAPKE